MGFWVPFLVGLAIGLGSLGVLAILKPQLPPEQAPASLVVLLIGLGFLAILAAAPLFLLLTRRR